MKRDQIRQLLQSEPHVSLRDAGTRLGVSPGYVHFVKQAMQASDQCLGNDRSVGRYVTELTSLLDTGQRFGAVYIDPPWPYGNQATRASTHRHYTSMSLDALKALPVADLMADDSHMHLWTTNGFLAEALQLMSVWGCTYKSMLIWCKRQMGIGNYWRVSHELLLLGIRGHCPFRSRRHKSWFECSRGKHSAKPEEVRQKIEQVSPGPYLELFGRQRVDRWTVWGNQLAPSLFNTSLEA